MHYVIFKNFKDYTRGGVLATQRFLEMVNDVLNRHHSDEKVYPIGKGLDGQLIFLTQQQFSFISSVYPNNGNKPLGLKEWIRM